MMNQRASWIGAATLIATSSLLLYLLISGRDALAVFLAVVCIAVAPVSYQLVQRRRFPARIGTLHEMVHISHPPHVVWNLIKPAEKAPLVDPDIRRGYRVPGTPEGLGEQQALERHDGWTVIIEVVEYEPGRRAMTRQVSPPPAEHLRTIQCVDPVDGGCDYTMALELDLQAGQKILRDYENEWRSSFRRHVSRLEELLTATRVPDESRPTKWAPPPPPGAEEGLQS